METNQTYTIDLGNGEVLKNVTINGNNYVYDEDISEETFEGMETVTIEDSEGNVQTLNSAVLVALSKYPEGWYFVLRELTEEEIRQATNDAQILFTAIATDTLLEE